MTDGGRWYVRFAGRVTGPFETERLRTMAARGALTPLHFLSSDGNAWVPASKVRAVFGDERGDPQPYSLVDDDRLRAGEPAHAPPAAAAPAPLSAREAAPPVADPESAPRDRAASGATDGVAAPTLPAGSVSVRPIVAFAVLLAFIALVVSALGALPQRPEWFVVDADALGRRLVVRLLQAIAAAAGLAACAMGMTPTLAAASAAVACVVACASAIDAAELPWTRVAMLVVPLAAVLCALSRARAPALQAVSVFALAASPLAAALSLWLAVRGGGDHPAIAGSLAAIAAAGCLAVGIAAWVALRRPPDAPDRAFLHAGAGAAAVVGAALLGAVSMSDARGVREVAVDACVVLAASGAAWAWMLAVLVPRGRSAGAP